MEQKRKGQHIRRVAIVFAGGPAPAANAVISAAAVSFLDDKREVLGFLSGYENLQEYHPITNRLQLDKHYIQFELKNVLGFRNTRGVMISTSRANPGKLIEIAEDLEDPQKTEKLHNIYTALIDLGIDALISIGGDDTLKTANYLFEFQKRLPEEAKRVHIVHLPKTIDNDYEGIDFTFGYFTAVDFMAKELQNLRADAASSNSYFIVEAMGRKAGWLAYGVGIAGEANMIFSVEDVTPDMLIEDEYTDEETGEKIVAKRLDVNMLINTIVNLMLTREERENKGFGTIVLAEGLGELLPERLTHDIAKDEHGHISIGKLDIGKLVARMVGDEYKRRTGRKKKIVGLQLGYESRCAMPHAFDVMLGSQLGIGAYRALIEEGLSGYMVSTTGQLDLNYVSFDLLVNPKTLRTAVRYIKPGSDFHRLARFLETRTEMAWDKIQQVT